MITESLKVLVVDQDEFVWAAFVDEGDADEYITRSTPPLATDGKVPELRKVILE